MCPRSPAQDSALAEIGDGARSRDPRRQRMSGLSRRYRVSLCDYLQYNVALVGLKPCSTAVQILTAWQGASQVVHKREESARPMQFHLGRRFGPMQLFPIVHRTSQDTTGQHNSGPRVTARPASQSRARMIPESTASPHPCNARVMLITMVWRASPRSIPVKISALCGAAELLSKQFA